MKSISLKIISFAALLVLASCTSALEKSLETKMQSFKETADFGSVEYTVKKVIKANDVGEWYKVGDRKILFTSTAYLKAGIDMTEFTMDNVVVNGKDVVVMLPKSKLLSINMPANEIQLVYDQVSFLRSSFSAEERTALLKQGEEAIIADINNLGILTDAEKNAQDFFQAMLKQIGFETVTINFRNDE